MQYFRYEYMLRIEKTKLKTFLLLTNTQTEIVTYRFFRLRARVRMFPCHFGPRQ